jgi:hypothetical protein
MKLIFLDIDGVLNCSKTWKKENGTFNIDDNLLNNLKRICDAHPGCKIILTSTWRLFQDHFEFALEKLSSIGLNISDKTPECPYNIETAGRQRGMEIKQWIKDNNMEGADFIIIDDDSDFLEWQLPFHIHTNFEDGLTDELTQKAINLLGDF